MEAAVNWIPGENFNLAEFDKWEPIKSQVRVSWVISCHLAARPRPGVTHSLSRLIRRSGDVVGGGWAWLVWGQRKRNTDPVWRWWRRQMMWDWPELGIPGPDCHHHHHPQVSGVLGTIGPVQSIHCGNLETLGLLSTQTHTNDNNNDNNNTTNYNQNIQIYSGDSC